MRPNVPAEVVRAALAWHKATTLTLVRRVDCNWFFNVASHSRKETGVEVVSIIIRPGAIIGNCLASYRKNL